MCRTDTHVKSCGCSYPLPGIAQCLEAVANNLPDCGKVENREVRDPTPCPEHPSSGASSANNDPSGGASGANNDYYGAAFNTNNDLSGGASGADNDYYGAASSNPRPGEASRTHSTPQHPYEHPHNYTTNQTQDLRHFQPRHMESHDSPASSMKPYYHGESLHENTSYPMREHHPHGQNTTQGSNQETQHYSPYASTQHYSPYTSTHERAGYTYQPSSGQQPTSRRR
ncbi:hypothetical protein PMIN06_000776 [Paraphaeosphaeria minitans]|uniref:Uncharacterized protein n=1 Tax=Paraphaeosphaeria minitans TaxID=565426 RepID=A0A9P6KQC5_9PLEO|nr:hypothetical protein PMIN01_06412 [Paraphaeosphaeria minitans]